MLLSWMQQRMQHMVLRMSPTPRCPHLSNILGIGEVPTEGQILSSKCIMHLTCCPTQRHSYEMQYIFCLISTAQWIIHKIWNRRNNVRRAKPKIEAERKAESCAEAMVFGIPILIIIVLISSGTCHFRSAYTRIRCTWTCRGSRSMQPFCCFCCQKKSLPDKNVHYLLIECEPRCLSMALLFSRWGTMTTTIRCHIAMQLRRSLGCSAAVLTIS